MLDLCRNAKYHLDKDFFSIFSLNTCYWAGFIAADGCVLSNKNTIQISASTIDVNHLLKFKNAISFNGPIKNKIQKSWNVDSFISIIQVSHPQLKKDILNNYNIGPNKSLILEPPNLVNKEEIFAFIKGLIDGDGSISFIKPEKGIKQFRIRYCGTQKMCEWVKENMDKYFPNKRISINAKVTKSKSIYEWGVAGNRAKEIYIYLKSLNTDCLDRKWLLEFNNEPN